MALVALGDLHLSDDRDWSLEVSARVVDNIVNHPLNRSGNSAVFLGDITDKAIISGPIIALLEKLFRGLRYDKVWVIRGNHELKFNKAGQETYVLDFLKSPAYPTVEVIEVATTVDYAGEKFLMLPYFNPQGDHTMKNVYEALELDYEYAAVFGHLQDDSLDLPGESINLSKIRTKDWCLGHIHNPDGHYLGSYIPNSESEKGKLRKLKVYDKGGVEVVPLRTIIDYYDVMYPDPLPATDCDVPVFTIYNCADPEAAREKYGKIHVKKCIYRVSMDIDAFKALGSISKQSVGAMSPREVFTEFKKAAKFDPPEVGDIAERYLVSN